MDTIDSKRFFLAVGLGFGLSIAISVTMAITAMAGFVPA